MMTGVHQAEVILTSRKTKRLIRKTPSFGFTFADVLNYRLFLFYGGTKSIAKKNVGQAINAAIPYSKVRLIDENGEMLGVVPIGQALAKAEAVGLDLVLIANNPENPVCRIMDNGKFLFEKAKREKEAKKKQKVVQVKEVGLKLSTEEHDLSYKVKNAVKFLEDGDRVKVSIRFRGREMAYTSQGYAVMDDFVKKCGDIAQVDRAARVEGRNMVMYLSPKKQ